MRSAIVTRFRSWKQTYGIGPVRERPKEIDCRVDIDQIFEGIEPVMSGVRSIRFSSNIVAVQHVGMVPEKLGDELENSTKVVNAVSDASSVGMDLTLRFRREDDLAFTFEIKHT